MKLLTWYRLGGLWGVILTGHYAFLNWITTYSNYPTVARLDRAYTRARITWNDDWSNTLRRIR